MNGETNGETDRETDKQTDELYQTVAHLISPTDAHLEYITMINDKPLVPSGRVSEKEGRPVNNIIIQRRLPLSLTALNASQTQAQPGSQRWGCWGLLGGQVRGRWHRWVGLFAGLRVARLGIEACKNCMALHYHLSARRVLWPGSHLSPASSHSKTFTVIHMHSSGIHQPPAPTPPHPFLLPSKSHS